MIFKYLFLLLSLSASYKQIVAEPLNYGDYKEIGQLNIGVILPLSGNQAKYGLEAKTALEIAYKQISKKDPKLANHIRFSFANDNSTAQGALKAIEELKEKRVSIIIGSVSNVSSSALAKKPRT